MPIRIYNPFIDKTLGINLEVNPYAQIVRSNDPFEGLPICHGPMLRECVGNWRKVFAARYKRPERENLIVEIGCHKGDVLADMAKDFENYDFLGLDITFKRVVRTAKHTLSNQCENAFSVLANAKGLCDLFVPEEVSGFVIFFPDPWTKKKRQSKHQLINHKFCQDLYSRVEPGGFVWFKTDSESYFKSACKNLFDVGFCSMGNELDILDKTYLSPFEQRFAGKNVPTFEAKWRKPTHISKNLDQADSYIAYEPTLMI